MPRNVSQSNKDNPAKGRRAMNAPHSCHHFLRAGASRAISVRSAETALTIQSVYGRGVGVGILPFQANSAGASVHFDVRRERPSSTKLGGRKWPMRLSTSFLAARRSNTRHQLQRCIQIRKTLPKGQIFHAAGLSTRRMDDCSGSMISQGKLGAFPRRHSDASNEEGHHGGSGANSRRRKASRVVLSNQLEAEAPTDNGEESTEEINELWRKRAELATEIVDAAVATVEEAIFKVTVTASLLSEGEIRVVLTPQCLGEASSE